MSSLFDPIQVGQMSLANRVVMAPLTRNRAPGGIPNALMETYYTQRASAGLIVTEGTAISPQAQGYADVPGLYSTEQLDGWKKITRAVHNAGGKIVNQLWHVGRVSHSELQPHYGLPVAPSAIRARTRTALMRNGVATFVEASEPRALESHEIPGIVQDFRHAARNAISCGFDGVEVHAANGYLLDQFLKTGANQRTDDYGGTLKNRARLLLEVLRAICDDIGSGHVGVRIAPVTPANDITDDNPQQLFDYVVHHLAELNLAYVHVIEGATGGERVLADRPFDYDSLRDVYRQGGGSGAWMVNNGYDSTLAASALANGADLVSFGRSFIANPDLVERLRSGAPLNAADRTTFYGGGAQGYTDYPALA